MKKLTNRHLLPFYLTLAAVAAHATPTLTFGTITGTQAPGNTITVNVLLTNNGAAVSGINFDLTYASGLTVSFATGSAASAAGKSLNSSNPQGAGAGVKRALIAGFNTDTIADGTVAAIVLFPIVAKIGVAVGHPQALMLAAAFVDSAAMSFPTSSFPNLNAVMTEDDYGRTYLRSVDFVKYGTLTSLLLYALIVSLGFLLFYALF